MAAANSLLLGGLIPSPSLDLILRLPPLYVMDTILLSDMGLKWIPDYNNGNATTATAMGGASVRMTSVAANLSESSANSSLFDSLENGDNSTLEDVYWRLYGNPDWTLLPYAVNIIVCLHLYLASAFVVTLATRHLVVFYTYFLALLTIPLSYASHYIMADALSNLYSAEEEWFVHRHLSYNIPFVYSMSVENRAIVVNYVLQSCFGLLLGSVLRFHFDGENRLLFKVWTMFLIQVSV